MIGFVMIESMGFEVDNDSDIEMKYIDCYKYPGALTQNETAIIKTFAEFDNG